MIYLNREKPSSRKQFDIHFYRQVNQTAGQDQPLVYPMVDGQVFSKFTLNGIYDRYQEIWDYYNRREIPPRDYKLYYSPEEMEERIAQGLVAKTNLDGFRKKPGELKFRKANWECSYCDWKWHCWDPGQFTNEQIQLFNVDEEVIEDLDQAAG
jgi:hypothetical protein